MPDPQLTHGHPRTDEPVASAAFVVTGTNRRALLQRVGVAALAGGGALALAACGADRTSSGAPGSAAPSATGSSAGGTSPSAGGSSSGAASTAPSQAPVGTKVAKADVGVGGGIILADQKLVVTQPEEGTFKAFSAVCTHQACLVTEIVGTDIDCRCHGSRFSIVDGSVTNPPADEPLGALTVTESGGDLYVS